MHTLKVKKFKKYLSIFIPLLITSVLWVYAKYVNGNTLSLSFSNITLLVSQISALWGTVLLAISYIIVARIRQVEYFYGGLDKIYKLHKTIGKISFVLILLHPIILSLNFLNNENTFLSLYIPFYPGGTWAKTFGILSLYLYIVLILITLLKLLPYRWWKLTHNFMGIPFFLATYHGLFAESDVKYVLILKIWMLFWIILGLLAYIYKSILYYYIGPKYHYVVSDLEKKGDIHEIYLQPLSNRINFEPGEFIYLSVRNNKHILKEHHPFGFSSHPEEDRIRISFKVVGDYTTQLAHNLKVGDKVDIFGPFGEFSSYVFAGYKKQIWIAGGIGIAPFLSMLSYEIKNKTKKDIQFYYTGKGEEDCTYDEEIQEEIDKADDNISFVCWHSDKFGFLTAEKLRENIPDIKKYLILLCGPSGMMEAIGDQLIEIGCSEDMIVYEDFNVL